VPAAWRAAGRPGYSCVQQQHTYLLAQPEPGQLNLITEELLDCARSEQLALLAYSILSRKVWGSLGRGPSGGDCVWVGLDLDGAVAEPV
jgi:hypothetical protein